MTRPTVAAVLAALSLLLLPAAALAAGPMVGGWSTAGVAVGKDRYIVVPFSHSSLLERIVVRGGELDGYQPLRESVGVPMVALDGTGGGLSWDQQTLVLTAQLRGYRHPISTFYLVKPRTLLVKRKVTLHGDFAFDAISPDGRTIYLIKLDPRNITHYSVRAFDTVTGELLPRPVVDPREPDEQMRGLPQARRMSPDGRFAYTLYTGGKEPFIHSLDTVGGTAACIDLPALPQDALLALRLDGPRLAVLADNKPVAFVNPVTREVTKPGRPEPRRAASDGSGSGSPALWAALAAAAALALVGAAAMGLRRRRTAALRS